MPTFQHDISELNSISVSSTDQKYGREFFGNSTKFFLKFEDIPLADSITGHRLSIVGSSAARPFLEDGAFGNALRLRPQSYLSYDTVLPSQVTEFSMGFWLLPINVKPAISVSTEEITYYRLALLDKATFEEDDVTHIISAKNDDTSFVIYEECRLNNHNKMYILLQSGANEEIVFSTEIYEAGKFHFFWITYNGPAGLFVVFIDGIETELTLESGISLPSSIQVNHAIPFHINYSAIGYEGTCRGNSGLLDELIFQLEFVTDGEILARHINLGSEYVINDELFHQEEIYQALTYDDPTTIDITAAYSNGTNIYLGRSDGKLMKADRTIWQVRRDFSNRDEINFVKKNFLATDAVIEITDGNLKIKKASVRI